MHTQASRRVGVFALLLLGAALPAAAPTAVERLKQAIAAEALRAHVAFLASDLLEGRDTPSRGLEIAAEYIAAQFLRAGLEPAGGDGYFQAAALTAVQPKLDGFRMTVTRGEQVVGAPAADVTLGSEIYGAISLRGAGAVKVPYAERLQLAREQVEGKVVFTQLRAAAAGAERAQWFREIVAFRNALRPLRPALVVNVNPEAPARGRRSPAYMDAEARRQALPSLTVNTPELAKLYGELPAGPLSLRVDVEIAEPDAARLTGRNVVAVLRGADPNLAGTCVLLSAHYDHVGERRSGEDRIFNGANDNASGVSSLIEIAAAFARLTPRPRRSLLFVAYFGEEKGMIGSRYYARHPAFPLARTVANINLEHMGRTDDLQGSQAGKATLTGFELSAVGPALRKAAAGVGYDVYSRPGNEAYFDRSDNAPLAAAGVPAHTFAVAFEFPDYHEAGDTADKLDYSNMERATEAVAAGLLALANSPTAPRWNPANPKAREYAARKASN